MEEKQTILIVEDDKYIIHFISMSLKEENYTFWTAKSVKEALSLFYANRPDLVILDLGTAGRRRTGRGQKHPGDRFHPDHRCVGTAGGK